LLTSAQGTDAQDIKHDVLVAIVSMCSKRILCRLRLVPSKRNAQKQSIIELLQKARMCINNARMEKLQHLASVATLFVERVKEVIKLMRTWIKHQIQPRLVELVEGIYHLWQVGSLADLLNTIPNSIIDPSARTSLFNVISKVARYREAGRFLYRAAKRIPSVRDMKTTIVVLPKAAFGKAPTNEYGPELQRTISRISMPKQFNLNDLCRLLGISERAASDAFAKQTKKTLTEAKIHAEIQLLSYCEQEPYRLRPRIICSSKDACFLCNAFILACGKMHIPRSHGRLYPGWRLPRLPELHVIEQRFNQALEEYIRNSLETLSLRRRRTLYPVPNESTLLTLRPSVSTLLSLEESGAAIEVETEPERAANVDQSHLEDAPLDLSTHHSSTSLPENGPLDLSAHCSPTSPLENTPNVDSKVEPDVVTADAEDEAMVQPSDDSASKLNSPIQPISRTLSSTSTLDNDVELSQGCAVSGSMRSGHKSRFHVAGHLRVQIQPPAGSKLVITEGAAAEFTYGMTWLADGETKKLQQHRSGSVINVEALKGDVLHEIDDSHCLHLSYHGTVVKVCLRQNAALLESSDGFAPL
jgi:hypothetical protein